MFITEWNSLDSADAEGVDWFENPTIDGIASAAVAARIAVELDDVVAGLFWWVASDVFEEAGMPQSPFSGTYGLLTVDGIPKPSFHVFQWLASLKGELLESPPGLPEGCGAVAAIDGDVVRALLWNHVPPGVEQRAWTAEATVEATEDSVALVRIIRPGRGSAFETWKQMGEPQDPTPAQMDLLRSSAVPEGYLADATRPIRLELGANEVAFLEWAPKGGPRISKELLSESSMQWNAGLAEAGGIGAE
jgi:xylan 1,4-beta-xylosidase